MTTANDPSLALVQSALGRSRLALVVLAIVVAGLAWLCTLGVHEDGTLAARIMAWGVVGFFALLSVLLLWVAIYKNSPSRSPLVVALRNRPTDVVWIYQQDVAVNVHGIAAPVRDANVIARLRDGSTVAITVSRNAAPALLAALAALAPSAAVGYSSEREAQFEKDPQSVATAGA